jgi:ATP-dependent RNA helicase DeaD
MNDDETTAATPPPAATDPAAPQGPSFAELGLGPAVLTALAEMGFSHPMKVQAATLPKVLEGRDLMVQSRTGSGKTAAFGIPLIDKVVRADDKFVQAIILLPTRELALQVASELARIAAHSGITIVPVYGGAPMGRQIEQLKAGGQIVCGTPGRIMDHMRRGTLQLDRVRCAILDECDEMLSMGFQEDIEKILERTPVERQTLLFSATVPEGIQRISRRFMRQPENLKLSADFVGVQEIRHVYYTIPGGQRENELLRVLSFENPGRAIVFCNTREETGRVAEFLRRQGFEAEAISSDLAQNDREKVMARMRAGGIRFLVATDVAARGIDLEALSHVINYTFPESPEVYIHRTGRTGRAGRHGTAISLIGPTEVGAFYYVKLLYKIKPEERSLPSEAEIRGKREGERIESLRARFAAEPGAGWRSLARRVMGSIDGERLCAALLAEVVGVDKPVAIVPTESVVTPAAGGESGEGRGRRDREGRDRDRDRPRYGARDGRDRDRPREGGRSGERGERGYGERGARGYGERGGRLGERGERGLGERGERGAGERGQRDAGERSVAEGDVAERGERTGAPEASSNATAPVVSPESTGSAGAERANVEGASSAGGERSERAGSERSERGTSGGYGERSRDRGERPRRSRDRDRDRERAPQPRESAVGTGEAGLAGEASEDRGDSGASEKPSRGSEQEFWSVWSDASGERSEPRGTPSRGDSPPTSRGPRRASPPADEAPNPNEARLFLNLGRKDDASPDEVLALFAELGVTVNPADIDVMNTHSYVNVPASEADRICHGLSGKDRNGRPLICERARPRRR